MVDSDDLYVSLGSRIAAARKRKKWSQRKLADPAKLTRGSIANIETGRQKAPLETLWRIGEALGIEPRLLIPAVADLELDGTARTAVLEPKIARYVTSLSTSESKVKAFIAEAKAELGEAYNDKESGATTSKKNAD